jgi:hypothetical protein
MQFYGWARFKHRKSVLSNIVVYRAGPPGRGRGRPEGRKIGANQGRELFFGHLLESTTGKIRFFIEFRSQSLLEAVEGY